MTDKTIERLREKLKDCDIPSRMHQSLLDYIVHGRPVGHFLTAVLCNDLKTAVLRGDDENVNCLAHYVYFLYNYAPSQCWGNADQMAIWRERFVTTTA